MFRFSIYLSTVFLCCIVLGVYGSFPTGQYYSIGKVDVVEWDPDRPFADVIAKELKPVILRNTVVQQWPALEKWTPDFMAEHSPPTVLVSRQMFSRIFTYANSKRPMNVLFPKQHTHENIRMNLTEFWTKSKQYPFQSRYYTGGLEVFEKFGLRSDLQPHLEWMGPTDCQGRDDVLWMGTNGVTAQTHYDESHNFYTQIYGRKRFLLSPPEWIDKVHIFPWLHPSQRQSQVLFPQDVLPWSFENEAENDMVTFSGEFLAGHAEVDHLESPALQVNLPCYEAELQPGDVLYIPPFWLHRVEATKGFVLKVKVDGVHTAPPPQGHRATSGSISLSSWCDSQPERGVAARLLLRPLPIEDSWPARVKILALRFYLSALAYLWDQPSDAKNDVTTSDSSAQQQQEEEEEKKKIREFYGQMYQQQFSPLFGDEDGVLPFLSHHSKVHQVQAACRSGVAIPWKVWESNPETKGQEEEEEEEEDEDDDLGNEDPLASPEWHREMLEKARGAVQELRAVPHPTVRRVLLFNYVETVAHFLLGVEAVAPFLLQCLVQS